MGAHTGAERAVRIGGLGLGIVVLAIALSSVAAAAPVPGTARVYVSPYAGAKATTDHVTQSETCAVGKLTSPPKFDARLGAGTADLLSDGTSCAKQSIGQPISSEAVSDVFLNVPISFRGLHHGFTFNFSVDGNATTGVHLAGLCPLATVPSSGTNSQYCDLSAQTGFIISVRVLDRNGTILGGGFGHFAIDANSQLDNSSSCTSHGVCTYYNYSSPASGANYSGWSNFSIKFTVPAHDLAPAGGHYVIWVSYTLQTDIQIEGYPRAAPLGSSAYATATLAGGGFGFKLDSITIG